METGTMGNQPRLARESARAVWAGKRLDARVLGSVRNKPVATRELYVANLACEANLPLVGHLLVQLAAAQVAWKPLYNKQHHKLRPTARS